MDARQELEDLRRLDELESRAANTPSITDSAIEGIKQGGTAGFSDEIGGLIDAALSKTGNMFVPEGGKNPYEGMSLKEAYIQGRDADRAKLAEAKQAHPIATGAGMLAGGIPLGVAAGPSLGASAALGGAYGLGGSNADTAFGLAKDTAIGTGLGVASSKLGDLVGSAIRKAQTATPAISGAQGLAKIATGISEESLPTTLASEARPPDWFFKVRGAENVVPETAAVLPHIPDQTAGEFVGNIAKGGVAGHFGIPGGQAAMGIPYALSRTATAQRGAQQALSTAAPALKSIDNGIQSAAKFIGGPEVFGRLSPAIQQQIQKAASEGPRQLAITHFLLKSQNPEYQSATTTK